MTAGMSPLATLTQSIDALAAWAWRSSWQAALLALGVAAITLVLRKKLSPACRFWLWSLVLVRLAMPSILQVSWLKHLRTEPPNATPRQIAIAQSPVVVDQTARLHETTPLRQIKPLPPPPKETARPQAQSPKPARSVNSTTLLRTLPYLWFAGTLLLSLRILGASLRLARAVRRMPIIDDPATLKALDDCRRELRLRKTPRARELPAHAGPALVGFLGPCVLLPMSTIARLDPEELRLVLLHELAHVKRRDVLINWVATLIAVIHWFNPAAWLVLWRMRVERELACDEIVLRAAAAQPGGQRPPAGRNYARTILKLLETLSALPDAPATPAIGKGPAMGILEGREKAQIERRLVMIARFDTRIRRWSLVGLCLALLVTAAALTGAVRAQDGSADPNGPARPAQRRPNTSDEPRGSSPRPGTADVSASVEKIQRIRAAYPKLPDLSPQSQKIFSDVLQSHAAPTGDEVNRAKEQLWKTFERELIYVPGKAQPVNQQQIQSKFQSDSQALDKWIAAAGSTGAWADPNLRQYARNPAVADTTDPNDPESAKGREKLKKTAKVNFAGQALSDVIDFLRDVSGADILVDWRSLEAAGIPRDAPVELRLEQPVAIDHILDLICRTTGQNHINYQVDRGVVLIAAADDARRNMVTRAYDVSDLVNRPAAVGGEGASMPGAGGGRGGPVGAGAAPVPAVGVDPTNFVTDNAQLMQLYTLIVQTVEPDSWKEAGGQGTIAPFGTKLVVKNTEPAHRELAELLAMLREKPAQKTTTEKPR